MIPTTPNFMDWVLVDETGWSLKKGAPPEVVREFDKFMDNIENKEIPRDWK